MPNLHVWKSLQQNPDTPWGLTIPYRISGPLNRHLLEQSLNEIVSRHESLRTTFVVIDGAPRQLIREGVTLTLPLIDLNGRPVAEQEAEIRRLARQSIARFDLASGPLIDASLLRLREDEHVVLITIHHIITDQWSNHLFIREVGLAYQALARGERPRLPELPLQYADFASWEQQWIASEEGRQQLDFWVRTLEGATPLELKTDYPRPEAPDGSLLLQRSLVLPAQVSRALEGISQQGGVTLFMSVMAAFLTLLYHYSGQEDICVGTYTANRSRINTQLIIGYFVNKLTLRTDLSGNPTFRELLGRVRRSNQEAYLNQDLPFAVVEEAVKVEGASKSGFPLHRVLCNYQETTRGAMAVQTLSDAGGARSPPLPPTTCLT